jgi:2-dehydropantoate 2-reductase
MIFFKKKASVAVIGCGAVGTYFATRLARAGYAVLCIVKPEQIKPLSRRPAFEQLFSGSLRIRRELDSYVDHCLVCTHMDDLESVLEQHGDRLQEACVITVQNGIGSYERIKKYIAEGNIITGVLTKGMYFDPQGYIKTTSGELVLGMRTEADRKKLHKTRKIFGSVLSTHHVKDIVGAQYLKLFINMSHPLAALTGQSLAVTFADHDLCVIAMKLRREAYTVISAARIRLSDIPSFPKGIIERSVAIPLDEAAQHYSQAIRSKKLGGFSGSIDTRMKKKRSTEVDYINGEIVRLARINNRNAPLHGVLVDCVHESCTTGNVFLKRDLVERMNSAETGTR